LQNLFISAVGLTDPMNRSLQIPKLPQTTLLLLIFALGLGLRVGLGRFSLVGVDLTSAYYPPALSLLGEMESSFGGWEQWHIRLGVILPLSLFHWFTGRVDMAIPMAALPFSILQIAMVFYIGRLLWTAKVGLLAAFIEALYPVSVVFGAKILPDTPMACFVTGAMLFFYYGCQRQ